MNKRAAQEPRDSLPAFIPPMNATLVAAPFDDPNWLFEVKWDGFRVETIVDRSLCRTMTRGGLDAGSLLRLISRAADVDRCAARQSSTVR